MKLENFTIETQGVDEYLVYRLDRDDEVYFEGKEIVTGSKIKGIAQTLYSQIDEEQVFKFNITGKTTLSELFKEPVTRKRLTGVFCGIIDAVKNASERYFLDIATFVLDERFVFVDERSNEVELICLPLDDNRDGIDFRSFFKRAMEDRRFDERESMDYVARIQNYLNGSKAFSLDDFSEHLNEISGNEFIHDDKDETEIIQDPQDPQDRGGQMPGGDPPDKPDDHKKRRKVFPPDPVEPPETPKEMSIWHVLVHSSGENWKRYFEYRRWVKENKAGKKEKQKKKKAGSDKKSAKANASERKYQIPGKDNTAVDNGMNANKSDVKRKKPYNSKNEEKPSTKSGDFPPTIIVGSDPSTLKTEQFGGKGKSKVPVDMNPRIVRVSDKSSASIDKDEFIIGRNRDEVDYVAGNSTYIGRKHCKIIRKGDDFFIVDISSNGTSLNGGELEKGAAEHLSHDDRITIINEDFIFKLY